MVGAQMSIRDWQAGDAEHADPRFGPATRLECKVCWYVYDPAVGDPVWQVPAGTPFVDLPAHWSCPNCAGERTGFIVVADEA
jgi:rubredoxin